MKLRKMPHFIVAFAIVLGTFGYGWIPASATKETVKTVTQKIIAQAREDVFLGRSGVFFPSSAYTGALTLTRIEPKSTRISGLRFTEPFIEMSLATSSKYQIEKVTGIVYVYFKLLSWERRLWEEGKLSIYQLDPKSGKWVACPNLKLVAGKNSPHGRLACVVTEFGTYAMAATE